MRYVYLLVFVYLSVLFVFSSCEREDLGPAHNDACIEDNNAFEDMKAWYYFKQGTYWVYQEQNSGQLDTLIVYQDSVQAYEDDTSEADSTYQFEWDASSSLNYIHHQWVNTSWSNLCSTRSYCTCHKVFKSRSDEQGFVGEDRPFMYPHFEGNWIFNLGPGGHSTISSLSDSLVFGKYLFKNVATYTTEIDLTWGGHSVTYQFAKNVGMISRVVPDLNEDWRLVEYSVVQ